MAIGETQPGIVGINVIKANDWQHLHLARNAQLPRGTSVAACGSSAPMPLRGTRSRAIRRRTPKEGANLGKGGSSLERASALKPQQRKQKKQRKEASRHATPDARKRVPPAPAAETSKRHAISGLAHHRHTSWFIVQVRPKPTFHLLKRHSFPATVVLNLILTDFSDPEIL